MAEGTLTKARKQKADEFYTQLTDIEKEAMRYKDHFKGKTVLCNCDDPRVSQFFYFFFSRFNGLRLKRLIATCYKNLNPDLFTQNLDEQAVYCIYDGKDRADDVYTDYETFIKQNEWGILKGDGDFRSSECIELLKQSDIVVTNPPFSLFREYVAQLMEHEKKFLIIGSKNAITYKEIFKLIKENKMWLGYGFANGNAYFNIDNPRDFANGVYDHKTGLVKFRNVSWFTNLDYPKRHEDLILSKNYSPKEYPKYDNFDAIEVSKIADIPSDYDGVMGVPVTFLDKYNPEQFEIIGVTNHGDMLGIPFTNNCFAEIKGERKYVRILIKKRK